MSNGRSRSRRLRLASDLRGEALGLSKYDVSGRLFVDGLYWVKKASFSSCFERFCFVVKGVLDFARCFFCVCRDHHAVFVLRSVNMLLPG